MRIIYEPKGKALEYAPLAVSLYKGCSHGCTYCFAPDILHKTREAFKEPSYREGSVERLEKDASDMEIAGDDREVLMSFTTDPFQPLEETVGATMAAIKIFNRHGIRFTTLTKAGMRSIYDIDLFTDAGDRARYGTTLTVWDDKLSLEWEPGAATGKERIKALKHFSDNGVQTWVSCEPIISIYDTLECVKQSVDYVDEYRFGKLNYVKGFDHQDWIWFIRSVINLMEQEGKRFIFKKDLQPFVSEAFS
jgi:DNA repair photolyase